MNTKCSGKSSFIIEGSVLKGFLDKNYTGLLYVPLEVTEIADKALLGCNFSEIVISDNCKSVGELAIAECPNLKKVTIKSKDIYLKYAAFYNCSSLEEVFLLSTICFHESVFEDCSNLKRVIFDDEVRSIGISCFKNCVSLVEVDWPKKLYSIQYEAFSGCKSLVFENFPPNLTKIAIKAFENCSSLQVLNFTPNIKLLYNDTFSGCSSLKKVNIPEGMCSIEKNVFKGCSIEQVHMPQSLLNLDKDAFDEDVIITGFKDRPILFPDAPKDIIVFPLVGEKIKPIYYNLFRIKPYAGYDIAYAAINLMNGNMHRIDSKQVSYGVVSSGKDEVSGLSYEEMHLYDYANTYKDMTLQNWKDYIPKEELEKTQKNRLKQRFVDDSFTSKDDMGIDGLYLRFDQRYACKVFYFRQTQTGYRLYCGRKSRADFDVYFFDEKNCTEEFMYNYFVSFHRSSWTSADEEKDLLLTKKEFEAITASASDLFAGSYIGFEKQTQVPVSIYGDDKVTAVLWKNGMEIPCGDHPKIEAVYDALNAILRK